MKEDWRKQMQQKMADYRQPAPEVSWDVIDKAMAGSKPHKLIPFNYWLRGIAAAVVLLLITGISIRFMHQQEETPLQQSTPLRQTAPVNNPQFSSPADEQLQPQLTDSPSEEPQPTYMAETAVKVTPAKPEPVVTVDVTEYVTEESEVSAESDNETEEIPVLETEEQATPIFDYPDVSAPANVKHQSGLLLAQAYMSNAMTGSRYNEFNRQTVYQNILIIPDGLSSSSNIPINYDTIINVNTVQTKQNIHHHQPLRFGLSLRYQFSERWCLESGLTYTLLISDITTLENGITTYSKQKLHYLGLPLNVGYQLLKDRHFGLYVTAGGTIDKNLNGSDWQFSLNGSAGAEYLLSNRLSIYAEPGIGYYLPNGSNLSTIYQDQPLSFNINIGLRFNLRR